MNRATILDEIISHKREEVADAMARRPVPIVRREAEKRQPPRDFAAALLSSGIRIIAECKKQSPSKGLLKNGYDPVSLAKDYERGGAAAISCLTDQRYFGGHLNHLTAVRDAVGLPVLRKDFIVGEYQVYEARAAGADSFLLLAGVLGPAELAELVDLGRNLGMEALVESHTPDQLDIALNAGARILGINNRNLETFEVNLDASKALASTVLSASENSIPVCESGIHNPEDIARMEQAGFRAFLIGETLVRAEDPVQTLRSLRLY